MATMINEVKLFALKIQYEIACQEMNIAIDKANELKSQIFRIEAERDKNEPKPLKDIIEYKDRCPYCKKPMAWDQFKEIWICRVHGKFDEGILP